MHTIVFILPFIVKFLAAFGRAIASKSVNAESHIYLENVGASHWLAPTQIQFAGLSWFYFCASVVDYIALARDWLTLPCPMRYY